MEKKKWGKDTVITYHLFWNNHDEWYEHLEDAIADMQKLIEEEIKDIRIYKEIRLKNDNEFTDCEVLSEDCIFAIGEFPM